MSSTTRFPIRPNPVPLVSKDSVRWKTRHPASLSWIVLALISACAAARGAEEDPFEDYSSAGNSAFPDLPDDPAPGSIVETPPVRESCGELRCLEGSTCIRATEVTSEAALDFGQNRALCSNECESDADCGPLQIYDRLEPTRCFTLTHPAGKLTQACLPSCWVDPVIALLEPEKPWYCVDGSLVDVTGTDCASCSTAEICDLQSLQCVTPPSAPRAGSCRGGCESTVPDPETALFGTWRFSTTCRSEQEPGCHDTVTAIEDTTPLGTLTLSPDGASVDLRHTANATLHLDEVCAQELHGPNAVLDCQQFAAAQPYENVFCTEVSDGCQCRAGIDESVNDAGTWTANRTSILLDLPSGAVRLAYCLRGDTLTVHWEPGAVGYTLVRE